MARILVDMDGVIADWGKQYDADLDRLGAVAASVPRTEHQRAFNLRLDRTPAECDIIDQVMGREGFYSDLEPIHGATFALDEMVKDGHEVRICTSPWNANPSCIAEKIGWVRMYLGPQWVERVVVTHEKAAVIADILIDDRPNIPSAETAHWVQVLFDQPYNRDDPQGRPRITSWPEWHGVVQSALLYPAALGVDLGEVRSVSSTGGEKGTKPQRYDLLPVLPLDRLAELYANGAAKYAAHNWRRGYAWSNSYAAAMRHMTRFWAGEDNDPEMQVPHVTAAAFHMFALAQFMVDFPQFDDRYNGVK